MHRYRSPSPHTHLQDHPPPIQDRPTDGPRYSAPAADRWRQDEPHSSRASHSRHPPSYHDRVDSGRYHSSRSQNHDSEYHRSSTSSSARDNRSHQWPQNEQNRDNYNYKTEKSRHSQTRSQQQPHSHRGEQNHWQSRASERASWDRESVADDTRVLERSSWDRDPKDDPPRSNDPPRPSTSFMHHEHTEKWKKKNPNNRHTNRNNFQKRHDTFKATQSSRSRSRSRSPPPQPRGRSASHSTRSSPSPSPPKKPIHRLPVAGKRKRSPSPPSPVSATRPKPPPAEVRPTPDVVPTPRSAQRSGSALVRQFFPGDDDEDVEMPPPAPLPPVLPRQKESYPPRDDRYPPSPDPREHNDSYGSGRPLGDHYGDERSDSYRDRPGSYRDSRPGYHTGRYNNANDRRGDYQDNSSHHRRRQKLDDHRPDDRPHHFDDRRHNSGGYDHHQGGMSRVPQQRFNDRPREPYGDDRSRRMDDQVEDRTFYPAGDRRGYRRNTQYDDNNRGGGGRHHDLQREEYHHPRSSYHTSPALSHHPSPPSTPREPPYPPPGAPPPEPPREFVPNEYHRDPALLGGHRQPPPEDSPLPPSQAPSDHPPHPHPRSLDAMPTEELLPVEEATPPVQPPPPSQSGRTGTYQIVNQVGEGTFGKVYRAYNHATQLYVALKRIRMEAEKDGFPVTAMREIKLLQSLKHPNVVQLYEMMIDRGNVHMVFEYVSHDLVGLLSQSQFKLTPSHLKSLCRQMLSGLAYLHHKAVIHRDMKASNLLVSSAGELKIADFGLARFYQKRRQVDYTNRIITLWYRPPELLLGTTVYGPEVDMWSAGCIFIELFVTKPIFQGNDELHQLDVLYGLLGTPDAECLRNLPWYELAKPKRTYKCQFRETFKKWLPDDALDLAQALLNYDVKARVNAQQALETDYFKNEPAAIAPDLSSLQGDWHEYEYKLDKAARKRRALETESAPATV